MMAFAKFIQQTVDGGYFVIGNASTREYQYRKQGLQNGNISAFKTDSKGKVEWEQILGTDFSDAGESGKQTEDGGYIVTGTATVFVPGAKTASQMFQEQILLIKLNSSGGIQWQKEIGVPEENASRDIQLTNDGGYIIAGYYKAYRNIINGRVDNEPNLDFSVTRCDSSGNIIWTRTYDGKANDIAVSIAVCIDGSFVVAGTADISSFNENALILKIDASGNEIWSGMFGERGIDRASQVSVNQKGEIIVAGAAAHEGQELAWLFKLDNSGVLKWNTYYEGPVGRSHFKSVKITKDGNTIAGGFSDSKEGIKNPYDNNHVWILKLR